MNINLNYRSASRHRILLIDDRRDAIFPVQRMLEMAGHEVYAANDGSIGLQMAIRLAPDVILCDIGLPGELNGYDVATAIRSVPTLKGVYIVAVSGHGDEDDRRLARESGFDFHITKPMSKEQLDMLMTSFPRFAGSGSQGTGSQGTGSQGTGTWGTGSRGTPTSCGGPADRQKH